MINVYGIGSDAGTNLATLACPHRTCCQHAKPHGLVQRIKNAANRIAKGTG